MLRELGHKKVRVPEDLRMIEVGAAHGIERARVNSAFEVLGK